MTNPGDEGLAFILAADPTLLKGSDGQWLGIVNASTNEFSQAVAVEFDTSQRLQSYLEDLEDFHAMIHGRGSSMMAKILLSVNGTGEYMPMIFRRLNLSNHLPEMVYVGFSTSISNYMELNCVKSWEFDVEDIDEGLELLWVWITVPAVLIVIISGIVFYYFWERKHREQPEDAYPRIEDQIRGSSMAPRKFKLRELRSIFTSDFVGWGGDDAGGWG
ncbi:hypothetical protein FH972_020746 [Carpinus fangiana]|uniref:Legume lectin domain-containing protein n=1 Tax=Carpinus fangiana TaxID=176857 RepID=A0A5N6RU74_9ROSI|nr:hypothetical protein FH972_020746 [Carpinus fangiana]